MRATAPQLTAAARAPTRRTLAGDVWAVVGWSEDIVKLGERTGTVEVLAPASGTALWADVWAVPAGARGGHLNAAPSPLVPAWLEFGLQPGRVPSLHSMRTGASPLLLPPASGGGGAAAAAAMSADDLRLGNANSWMPPEGVLRRSEFLLPLDDDTRALYQRALAH